MRLFEDFERYIANRDVKYKDRFHALRVAAFWDEVDDENDDEDGSAEDTTIYDTRENQNGFCVAEIQSLLQVQLC